MTTSPEIGLSINSGGIVTNYHDQGQGAPVLLLHGSGPGVSAWANWRLVIPHLADNFRVIAPDIVGFGFTERPDDIRYKMETWLRHALDFLDAMEIEQAHVVGNSFGGSLAVALAVHAPERVSRLVLMGSVGLEFELTEGLDLTWGYTPSLDNMRRLLDLFAYNRELVTDELAQLRYEASLRPGVQESYAAMFPAPRQDGIRKICSSEADVSNIAHETLIVHGRDDRIIPVSCSEQLFKCIKNSQLHIFGNCGHWTQIEHNQRFNKLVTDFLLEVD
ncbi:MAG: alpha/beta hydrolase [Gammaproteobacteria bacterium]|nr:alpha/beta hydrolase [Gammaproteobacteria bacterium]